jgi:signal transduction histidine kinase
MNGLVLIVDDDEALADNLSEIVRSLGVETVVAPDGASALEIATARDLDVALVDVRLPDRDGMSLLEPLRARAPFVESVMVTGNATIEGAMEAVRAAAFAYVLKPVSPPDLLDTVRRALEHSALQREQERLRRELERSEQRHRELVESVPAFVVALDHDGRITTWNRQLERVTGRPRREMLGEDGRALVGTEVGTDERARDLPVKGGSARRVRWSRSEVTGPDGTRFVYAVGIDVTEEQEIQRRMLRSERLAAVGTMAAGLAHEVRNPLNSASLQLTLLQRRLDRGDEAASVRPIVQIIKSEIARLDRLVRDFLAFSKPRQLEPERVDVGELANGVAALIAPEASTAGVAVGVEVPSEVPAVLGEPERLRQVLLNLTRNAVEAMAGRGGKLTIRAAAVAKGRVAIEVEDDGPGFSEELPVFDAFFTTKEQGTGLGLSLVHRIVTDHGGTIQVTSRPGRTCFTVTLPRA